MRDFVGSGFFAVEGEFLYCFGSTNLFNFVLIKEHDSMLPPSAHSLLFAALVAFGFHAQILRAEERVDFAREIKPILESSCVQCHGPEKQKGKLRLNSREAWLKGGDDGPVFKAGHPEESDFFKRIAMREEEDDVMPPKGKAEHLTPVQIELVKRWIVEGAEWPEGLVAVGSASKKGAEADPREMTGPPPSADELEAVAGLAKRGVKVRPIASGVNWRRADLRSVAEKLTAEDFSQLTRIPSIRELNLGGVVLRDEDLGSIAVLKNLLVLHLENTPITDAGLIQLSKLEKLDYLNLFGTAVTDAGLQELAGLKRLKWLYLAGTKATATGVNRLRGQLPNAIIEFGADFAEVATKDPEPPKKATPAPSSKAAAGKP